MLKKIIFWPAVLVIMSCGTFAQQTNDVSPAPLEILKSKWEKQVRLPRNFDPSLIPTDGAFNDPARSTGTASSTTPAGGLPATQSNPYLSFPTVPGRLPIVYVYSMRIKNVGSKVIAGVAWDYVFVEPDNKKEIGRHQFLSFETIRPDKTATFQGVLRSAPTGVLQLHDQRRTKIKAIETASIQCVLYSDNTIWKPPAARPGICEFLASRRSLLKRNQRAAGAR